MPRRQKLIVSAFILAGIGMFVGAGLIGNSGNTDQSVANNPAIDALIPNRGDEVLQQQTVGIDLAPGYRLVRLTISPNASCGFPVDVTAQTRHVEGLQQYLFSPGEDAPDHAGDGDRIGAYAASGKKTGHGPRPHQAITRTSM